MSPAAPKSRATNPVDLYAELSAVVKAEVASYKSAAAAGPLTVAAVWSLTMQAVTGFVEIAKDAQGVSEADKRAAIMKAAGDFYDAVLVNIKIPGVPNFVATNFLDPALRTLWLQLVDGSITGVEALIARVETSLTNPPTPTPAPTPPVTPHVNPLPPSVNPTPPANY